MGHTMNRLLGLLVLSVVVLPMLVGCRPSDVTKSPEYNFSSFGGTVWLTKVKVALGEVYQGEHISVLLAPAHFDSTQTNYYGHPSIQIISVLPVGTGLQIERLMRDDVSGIVRVWAVVEIGPNQQKSVELDNMMLGENNFIGPGYSPSTNWGVNTNILESWSTSRRN